MDLLTWFLLTWIGAACIFYLIGKLLSKAFGTKKENSQVGSKYASSAKPESITQANGQVNKGDNGAFSFMTMKNVSGLFAGKPAAPPNKVVDTKVGVVNGESCEWLNTFLEWLCRYYKAKPELLNSWIQSLNVAAKKLANRVGCEVVFEDIILESSLPPTFGNITADHGPRDHLSFLWLESLRGWIRCPKIVMSLVASQRLPDRLLVSNFEAQITHLSGEIQARIACIANELFLMTCFDGKPTMDIVLVRKDASVSEVGLVNVSNVEEAIKSCLLSAVTNLNVTSNRANSQPVHEAFRRLNASAPSASRLLNGPINESSTNSRLLVKVVKAQRLGAGDVVNQPYVTIEMDEPAQKHVTTLGLNISPHWEEQFLFDLVEKSEEILFEVYDHRGESEQKFLGLAIMGMNELKKNPKDVHVLTLQSRPYKSDNVSGTLNVQFMFLSAAASVDEGWHEIHEPGFSAKTQEVRRQFTIDQYAAPMNAQPHGEINSTSSPVAPPPGATNLVRSVSQTDEFDTALPPPSFSVPNAAPSNAAPANKKAKEDIYAVPKKPKQRVPLTEVVARQQESSSAPHYSTYSTKMEKASTSPPQRTKSYEDALRITKPQVPDYTKEPGHSIFGDIMDRLSFRRRKRRTPHEPLPFQPIQRGASLDRNASSPQSPGVDADASELRAAYSTPPSRDTSESREIKRPRRSQSGYTMNSEASDGSAASFYPQSTLVVETVQNDIPKYHLVPPNAMATTTGKQLMKRGKKLHVFNEHVFVAVRVTDIVPCHVCVRNIQRTNFGKQAYQCRALMCGKAK